MFIVFKNSRPAGNKKFLTYDDARNYARKLIRKNTMWASKFRTIYYGEQSNPALSDFGYSVKRV
jgi:hypothetical protein